MRADSGDRTSSAAQTQGETAAPSVPAPSSPPDPKQRRRPLVGAAVAGATLLVTVGTMSLLQRGDDPVESVAATTTTTTTVATTAPPLTSPTVPPTTAAVPAPAPEVAPSLGFLLSDQSGVLAVFDDGRTQQLTDRPAQVAYADGQGGFVYQEPNGGIFHVSHSGVETHLNAIGELQQVVDIAGSAAAVVIERTPIPDTEAFRGQVLAVSLTTNDRTVLFDRSDVVRVSIAAPHTLLTVAQEEFTGLSLLQDGEEVWAVDAGSGAVLQAGVLDRGASEPMLAYFRNEFASTQATAVVAPVANPAEPLVQYPIVNGVGLQLDFAEDTLAVTYGDGLAPFGFSLIDIVSGEERQPPLPGAATLFTAPVGGSGVAPSTLVGGWRVVNVPADDILNVRTGPGTEFERIGRLAPDDTDVEVTGAGFIDLDGSGWFEVRLFDGTVGYSSRRFLAPPDAWEVGFDELPCGGSLPAGFGEDHATPTPLGEGTVGTLVNGFAFVDGDECDRYVVALGSGTGFDGRLIPADHVPGGLAVFSEGTRIRVSLPGVDDLEQIATNDLLGDTLVLATQPFDFDAPLEIRLLRPFQSVARLTVLSNPARLVIDVRDAGVEPHPDTRPVIGDGATLIEGPIDPDLSGVGLPVTVVGYARWFEGQGVAEVRNPDGEPTGTITGPSVIAEFGGGTYGVGAAWGLTWGEFRVTIDDLPPDQYELFIGDDCAVDEAGEVWEPCGVTQQFVVAG